MPGRETNFFGNTLFSGSGGTGPVIEIATPEPVTAKQEPTAWDEWAPATPSVATAGAADLSGVATPVEPEEDAA